MRDALLERSRSIQTELACDFGEDFARRIYAAWIYALDTMIEQASQRSLCSWQVDAETNEAEASDDGDVSTGAGGIRTKQE